MVSLSNHRAVARSVSAWPTIASWISAATSAVTNGAEYLVLERRRSTSGSMIRLTVRLNGPPSSALSTSTPAPMARHACSITARRGCRTATGVSGAALIATG